MYRITAGDFSLVWRRFPAVLTFYYFVFPES
jgi:hypothetical protein